MDSVADSMTSYVVSLLLEVEMCISRAKVYIDSVESPFQNCDFYMWVGNSYCNDCRDLDLCRDAALLEHDWRCVVPSCGQPYDRAWIENALLQIVRQRERLYHLQDLVCVKCRQVIPLHETVKPFSNAHYCGVTRLL